MIWRARDGTRDCSQLNAPRERIFPGQLPVTAISLILDWNWLSGV
jgi:hypothetical protein